MPQPLVNEAVEMLEVRLAEALQAFAVLQSVNRKSSEPSGEAVRQSISERNGFWLPVTLGLQTTVLTSIVALLDKSRSDCATFYYVINLLAPAQSLALPQGFAQSLDAIRDKYMTYRHKLFAHNDLKRIVVAEAFDQEGFTWASIGSDITTLDYAAKVLGHVLAGQTPPSMQAAKSMLYSFNLAEVQSVQHSDALLREVSPPAPLLSNDMLSLRPQR